MNVPITRDVIC